MKRLFLYIIAGLSFTTFPSCDNAELPVLPNAIYLSDAVNKDEYGSVPQGLRDFTTTIKMTRLLDHPITVTLEIDEELVKEHNKAFEEDLQMLGTDYWVLYDTEKTPHKPVADNRITVTIPANTSTAVLPIKVIAPEGDESYVLPLKIVDVSEDIQVLANLNSVMYDLQRDFEIWTLWLDPGNSIQLSTPDVPSTPNWTVEFHVAFDFKSNGAKVNSAGSGQAFFGAGPDQIYMRIYEQPSGDYAGIDTHINGNLAVASPSGLPKTIWYGDSKYEGVWHHIAMVCNNGTITSYVDGVANGTDSRSQWSENFSHKTFSICWSGHTACIGYSELRIWNIARTQSQLKRNKYSISPDAEGLVAWFRFNDNSDELLKDSSGHGFDKDISVKTNENVDYNNKVRWARAKNDPTFTSLWNVDKEE